MEGLGLVSLLTLFGGYAISDAPAEAVQVVGIDRLAPLHADRQIHTNSLQWRAREKLLLDGRASLRLGATVSRATGWISQPAEAGLQRLDSPAWGAGPAVDGRFTLLDHGGWRLNLDASAAVLLYDRRFPAGGDHYNGMFQFGATLGHRWPGGGQVEAGWRWMHVSNGQGLGPQNPSYEARGLSLRWQRAV
jgi:hypothetical protein